MAIDTQELRRLAQAALAGPDGISLNWIKLLQDFQQEASPTAISELLDRLEAAERDAAHQKALADSALRVAEGWEEKCNSLRADKATLQQMTYSLKDRLEAAETERDELEERCAVLTDELRLAVRQNSRDRLMTAEELRSCEATLEESK